MKLVFKKDEEHQVRVFQLVDGEERDFSYVDMIRALMQSGQLEEPDISEGFTDAEAKSIGSMITRINRQIAELRESDTTSVP